MKTNVKQNQNKLRYTSG